MMAEQTTTIVTTGATGGLARRKLLPALLQLACKGRLPRPQTYEPGSWGPEDADAMLSQDGHAWAGLQLSWRY